MILCIGEILADMVGEQNKEGLKFKAFAGGAPFNVAINAKQAGARVGFVGRVGNDVMGRFCALEAEKFGLYSLDLQRDLKRNTTLAFVTLRDGERDFAFNRHDAADYNIEFEKIDFKKYKDLNIIHIGSLMLSEKKGRLLAEKIAQKAEELGAKLSFDLNFRTDIFGSFASAKKIYSRCVNRADILKFSDDELKLFTGIDDVEKAVKSLAKKGRVITVTMGGEGSLCCYDGKVEFFAAEKVKPVDTTGAGDAFFGTFLAKTEGKDYTDKNIFDAMQSANAAGARATGFFGAVKV